MRPHFIYIVLTFIIGFANSTVHAQKLEYTLKSCLESGLENNYSLRMAHNKEQMSRNNATLGNAGYLPTLDLTSGYKGTLDNIQTKSRESNQTTTNNGIFDQTINVGVNLNWTLFDGFNISTNYKRLKELEKQGETATRIAIEDFIARVNLAVMLSVCNP